jgi:Zn-dependent protease with chaperone function
MADFFELQERARVRTRMLVFLFVLAIVTTVLAVDLIAWFALFRHETTTPEAWLRHLLSQEGLTIVAIALMVIGFGSLRTMREVAKGGEHIARLSGAVPVPASTGEAGHRQLLNVVEEMSIASGTPAPSVYVMPGEPAINAFVAGETPSDAVLVVTRGLLETLNREELMGVVGHEFSHILNGDMRLNLKLWGILGGLFSLAQAGYLLIRSGSHVSSRSRKQGAQGAVVVIGLGLLAVGYIALFFGRLIKAAVSRQREFLADASSVQFNRQRDGLVQALALIERNAQQGLLESPQAENLSHLCFAQPLRLWWSGMLATHPPIEARIRQLWPDYRPEALERKLRLRNNRSKATRGNPGQPAVPQDGWTRTAILAGLGQIDDGQLEQAKNLKDALPETLWQRIADDPDHAKATLAVLLQLAAGDNASDAAEPSALANTGQVDVQALREALASADIVMHYNLAEHALKTLSGLPAADRMALIEACKAMSQADGVIRFEEFFLLALIQRRLQPPPRRTSHVRRLTHAAYPLSVLLSIACRLSGQNEEQARQSYETIWKRLALPQHPWNPEAPFDELHAALNTLNQLTPLLKKLVMEALLDCVQSDGKVTAREYQLLQLTGALLDVAVPLPSQTEANAGRDQISS